MPVSDALQLQFARRPTTSSRDLQLPTLLPNRDDAISKSASL
jgi:hypothetical protein